MSPFRWLEWFGLLILSSSPCFAGSDNSQIECISLTKTKEIQRADLYVFHPSFEPQGILVLCPGCNGSGEDFLKDNIWKQFAAKNKLALAGLSFASEIQQLQEGKGYYYAEQGSGKLLLDGISKTFPKELPILLYGFSGGAHFTSSFVEWKPERVLTWCAYSAEWWIEPQKHEKTPPGIVACGDYDGSRYGASQMFFSKGRSFGKPWTWISIQNKGHEGSRELDEFVRGYFTAILNLNKNEGEWCDIETKRSLSLQEVQAQPTLATWLPNKELSKAWRTLHHP